MKILLFLLCTLCAPAPLGSQTLSAPIGGIELDGEGRLQSIRGVLGNLLPGDQITLPAAAGSAAALSAAFSGSAGAVKTADRLLVTDAAGKVLSQASAPTGLALFAFAPDGSLEWVCYPQSAMVENTVTSASLDAASWGDAVVAMGPAGATFAALVITGSQLWLETVEPNSGSVLSRTPIRGAAPAVWFQGGWLVTTAGGLEWLASGATAGVLEIPVPQEVTWLQNAGPNTVAVNGRWLLNARFQLLEIPVRPERRSSAIREVPR
jgi:hypothetical protein